MNEILNEVKASMDSNRMRIALTGFSVGWGMFILVILLGAGNGLVKGIINNFGAQADNIVQLFPGKTQMEYDGLPKGREISILPADVEYISKHMAYNIREVHTQMTSQQNIVTNGKEKVKTPLTGVTPGYLGAEELTLVAGRDIMLSDLSALRKVCVISETTRDILFPDGTDPVGSYISVSDLPYLVIGVYATKYSYQKGHTMYAPQTTVAKLYSQDNKLSKVTIFARNVNSEAENTVFLDRLYEVMAKRLHFTPKDRAAVTYKGAFDQFLQIMNVVNVLQLFIWVVGIATLIGGIVGVSNIMLITVKERTRELGVRRAMGASEFSIIRLVLLESVFITMTFGYVGMMCAIGLTQLVATVIASAPGGQSSIFGAPTLSLGVIFAANVIMIVAGLFAGYFPAKKAVTIKLVDALTA